MNQVDVSPETVEKEWLKIADNFKIDLSENAESNAGESSETSGNGDGVIILSSEERAEKEQVTAKLLLGSLNMVLGMLEVTELDDSIKSEFSQSWAVVIVKRFPDNPVTDFMEAYGDLIAAGSATLILFGAVRKARRKEILSRQEVERQTKEAMNEKVYDYEQEKDAA
ncbi:hypothetical protein P8629_06980 [Hydrogenovibrio sp. 3SP14C1]|uniref:hypothetical protein n=1 Tax=Hydrogenovibrio sp. 3SP14C1 TaxID=3038774 RepID=UPI002415C5E2|nr:hypothetical protein [Hydrogenovibrio sp. 3SP14C1]MDG4812749.1 hypothetical protein [Hydrogenovibrio sp. 3SP14C1]